MTIIESIMSSNLLKEDNSIRIDEAVFKRNSKKLNISFVLTYAIDYETYMGLENHVSNPGFMHILRDALQDKLIQC